MKRKNTLIQTEEILKIKEKIINQNTDEFEKSIIKLDDNKSISSKKKLEPLDKDKLSIKSINKNHSKTNILLGKIKQEPSDNNKIKQIPTEKEVTLKSNVNLTKLLYNTNTELTLTKRQKKYENKFSDFIQSQIKDEIHEISQFLESLGLDTYINIFIQNKLLTINNIIDADQEVIDKLKLDKDKKERLLNKINEIRNKKKDNSNNHNYLNIVDDDENNLNDNNYQYNNIEITSIKVKNKINSLIEIENYEREQQKEFQKAVDEFRNRNQDENNKFVKNEMFDFGIFQGDSNNILDINIDNLTQDENNWTNNNFIPINIPKTPCYSCFKFALMNIKEEEKFFCSEKCQLIYNKERKSLCKLCKSPILNEILCIDCMNKYKTEYEHNKKEEMEEIVYEYDPMIDFNL